MLYTWFVPKGPEYADIDWGGDSLEILSSWPQAVKDTMGFELRKVQRGEIPDIGKPMPGIGSGVWELRKTKPMCAIGWYLCQGKTISSVCCTVSKRRPSRHRKMPWQTLFAASSVR